MRLSIRVGSAALLILAIFLIKRHIDSIEDDLRIPLSSFWRYSGSSTATSSSSQGEKASETTDTINVPIQTYETVPIVVPNDRALVMAKLASEDTSWVANDLNEWRNVIYTVDDPNASRHTPINKGRESLAYLHYIIEHYHDLPSLVVFLHSHKDGWPAAWHTDNMDYSNVVAIRNLQTEFVLRNGYANLRCQETPGCPEELRPLRNPPRPGQTTEAVYAQAWQELFNNTDVPEVIGVPCCSQFAVSRDQILQRPFEDYMRYYNWVLMNDLPDDITSRVMEYSWHIIFGQDPVYCPDSMQCYQDVYGNPYFW
ncbi:hypothetical protein BDV25DRAFT_89756 [Aspergillus avenaceus]|uniref:Uncharacterized protein n=1 Tax=Aspergillus avenaceus TaxID=36643 RepID=A0A5N6TZA1_ASPAV|nr:hypothetical protein BDV25DRAFT_89756 [Aspergillus avenaceus]